MKYSIQSICLVAILMLPLYGQNGDKKDPGSQIDPIPADQIPPSPFLGKEDALGSFEVAEGFIVENIAEESVHQPVSVSFDADGRAWVVEMTNYMIDLDATDENEPAGRIKVLEDTDGNGSLDKVTVFLEQLILPRACAVTSDGLLYAHQDKLFFIKRGGANGTTPEGDPILVDASYAKGGNAEHKANGLLFGRDNWYYSAKSGVRYRRVDGQWIKEKTGFRGQWGITQDDAGRLFVNTNSHLLIGEDSRPNLYRHHPQYTPDYKTSRGVGSNRVYPIRITPGVNRAYTGRSLNAEGKLISCTGAAGMAIYRGQNFPAKYYGMAFTTEPAGNLVKAIKVDYNETNQPEGSFPFKQKEFLASTDEWFRPVNMHTAPDGTLWMVDMYIGLIQHSTYMTTYLRKQFISRGLDKPEPSNGRIYRIRHRDGEVNEVPQMSQATVAELQKNLSHGNGTVRDTAQRLIVERITTNSEDLAQWNELNKGSSSSDHELLHSLWCYESVKKVPHHLIEQALDSENTDIVNSALELARYSSESVDGKILKMEVRTKTVHSYLFALGKQASPESHTRAVSVIEDFTNQANQLEAVYVSGLGVNATQVSTLNQPMGNALSDMLKLAEKSAKGAGVKAVRIPKGQKERYKHGESLYLGAAACSACHGLEGEGQAGLFPPLASSEWVNGNPAVLSKIILHGLEGPMTVNGKKYKGDQAMPAYKGRTDLSDEDLASLMTYIRYMKGNKGGAVSAAQVKNVKEMTKDRVKSYTAEELRKELK